MGLHLAFVNRRSPREVILVSRRPFPERLLVPPVAERWRAVCCRMAPLYQIHRAEHCQALFSNRIVFHFTLVIEDHSWPFLRAKSRPTRQLGSVWITFAGKCNPGIADFVCEGLCIGAAGRQARSLDVLECERDFDRVW